MGAFDNKPVTTIQDFFQHSYDQTIFNPALHGQDMRWLFVSLLYSTTLTRNPSFGTINRSLFRQEMIAVRLELLALAFMHVDGDDDHFLMQSMFTKDYLTKNGAGELWDTMGEYNRVIALSSAHSFKGACALRITTTMSDSLRFALATEFLEQHSADKADLECQVRVCNRCGGELAWESGATAKLFVARLTTRLGCGDNLDSDSLMALEGVLKWFYRSDKEAMSSVNFDWR